MRNPGKIAILVLVILLSLSLLPLTACDGDDPDDPNKSFIWEISSEANSIYLLGSIHVASPDIYPLDSAIENAFELADNLVVEVDITQVDEMYTLQLIMDYGTYPPGETLQAHISADLYTEVAEQFDFGIATLNLDSFRPWVVVTLLEQLQMQELGYNPEHGIDLHFINQAVDSGKDIIELETADFQIALISALPDELMILMLEDLVANPMTREIGDSLFEAWEDGDAAAMETLAFAALDEEPLLEPYYDVLIYARNVTMAETIEGFLADDDFVVAEKHDAGGQQTALRVENHLRVARMIHPRHGRVPQAPG